MIRGKRDYRTELSDIVDWGQIKEGAGLAMRFPRFTGRWREDKAPEDATTVAELVDLYRTARRMPAGS